MINNDHNKIEGNSAKEREQETKDMEEERRRQNASIENVTGEIVLLESIILYAK